MNLFNKVPRVSYQGSLQNKCLFYKGIGKSQGFSIFSDHTSYLDPPQRC